MKLAMVQASRDFTIDTSSSIRTIIDDQGDFSVTLIFYIYAGSRVSLDNKTPSTVNVSKTLR